MVELRTEVARLTGLVSSAETDKQKAAAELKDKYLRELAKLERKKNDEITKLEKKIKDAEDRGYKEGEATYIQQCKAAKDIFFKCGWKAAVAQLGYGQKTEVFQSPPPHFIPSYMVEYANSIQQKFFQKGEDDEDSAPEANAQLGHQSISPTPVVSVPPSTVMTTAVPTTELNQGVLVSTELPLGEARVDLDADLEDLFS